MQQREPEGGTEGQPSALRGGWERRRGRGTVEDAHVPCCCAAEGPPAARRSPHIRVPRDTQLLLRRPSPPRGTNTKLPAAALPLPSDGSYLRPSWVRLREACLRLQAAQLTRPEDEDGRHALCVSRSFHSGRDSWASGKGKLASILSAGAVGGLACALCGWAPYGGGSAPSWWRLVIAVISGHTLTLGPAQKI